MLHEAAGVFFSTQPTSSTQGTIPMFNKPSSMKSISLAAAMTAALMFGAAVHAQTDPTGKPSDSSGSVPTGAMAKTPEQRDAAKADKQAAKADKKQAKAAKRAARKSNSSSMNSSSSDANGTAGGPSANNTGGNSGTTAGSAGSSGSVGAGTGAAGTAGSAGTTGTTGTSR
jgi:hypothetical protein